ncbi:DUF2892 domain-containing protein [Bacillus sp. HMF5848]|nr:DUF2892 domain-containing protein [Bacillus sp. HMF5848]
MGKLFAPTTSKVNLRTKPHINAQIHRNILDSVKIYKYKSKEETHKRIRDLDYEWDMERTLEINYAVIVLLSTFLGLFRNKSWFLLAGVASGFMIQHVLQGWCPPMPLFRKLGVRTAKEIFTEQEALRSLLSKDKN